MSSENNQNREDYGPHWRIIPIAALIILLTWIGFWFAYRLAGSDRNLLLLLLLAWSDIALLLVYMGLAITASAEGIDSPLDTRTLQYLVLILLGIGHFITISLAVFGSVYYHGDLGNEALLRGYIVKLLPAFFALISLMFPLWINYLWNWHSSLRSLLSKLNLEESASLRQFQHTDQLLRRFIAIFFTYSMATVVLVLFFLTVTLLTFLEPEFIGRFIQGSTEAVWGRTLGQPPSLVSVAFVFIGPVVLFTNYMIFVVITFSALKPFERSRELRELTQRTGAY